MFPSHDHTGYRVIRRTRLRMKKVLGRGFTRRQRGEVNIYEQLGVENGKELRAHLESKWQLLIVTGKPLPKTFFIRSLVLLITL